MGKIIFNGVDYSAPTVPTQIGIDDTQPSTTTTYSSSKIEELVNDTSGTSVDLSNYYDKAQVDEKVKDKLGTTDDASNVTITPSVLSLDEEIETGFTKGKSLGVLSAFVNYIHQKVKALTAKYEGLAQISSTGSANDLKDIDALGIPDLINSLEETEEGKALDATQGKVLADKIGQVKALVGTNSVQPNTTTFNKDGSVIKTVNEDGTYTTIVFKEDGSIVETSYTSEDLVVSKITTTFNEDGSISTAITA